MAHSPCPDPNGQLAYFSGDGLFKIAHLDDWLRFSTAKRDYRAKRDQWIWKGASTHMSGENTANLGAEVAAMTA
jgi:hypothetical protein